MTFAEYVADARDCVQQAQYLTETGRRRLASEALWLAVKYAINALALATGQQSGKYQHKKAVVSWLAAEIGEPELREALRTAMQIHADADRGFMEASELLEYQVQTSYFVELLLEIAIRLNATQGQSK